jgi:hypothetical protein
MNFGYSPLVLQGKDLKMKAIVATKYGRPEVLVDSECQINAAQNLM